MLWACAQALPAPGAEAHGELCEGILRGCAVPGHGCSPLKGSAAGTMSRRRMVPHGAPQPRVQAGLKAP